ncbi:MAG: UBP-type zinc finger domain-containing protein [Pseudomonadota bacterium]
MARCTHLDMVAVAAVPEDRKGDAVCAACVAIGGSWVHLGQCRTCGVVLCCDDSPHRHARAHAEADDHPIITSAEPGERWSYCFVDDVVLSLD